MVSDSFMIRIIIVSAQVMMTVVTGVMRVTVLLLPRAQPAVTRSGSVRVVTSASRDHTSVMDRMTARTSVMRCSPPTHHYLYKLGVLLLLSVSSICWLQETQSNYV